MRILLAGIESVKVLERCCCLCSCSTVHLLVDNEFGEDQITFVEYWIIVFVCNGLIHQRMRANEIQYVVGQ